MLSEALLYLPVVKEHIDVSNRVFISNDTLTVEQSIDTTFQANLGISYYIINGTFTYSSIYYYYDSRFPTSESTLGNWYGLSQHLTSIITARGLDSKVVLLNATQLQVFLTEKVHAGSLLVMASGVIPDTIYGKNFNLLEPWIQNGGTLVWIGNKIGNLSGTADSSSRTMGANASDSFISSTLFGGNALVYGNASSNSRFFGINYNFSILGNGIDTVNLTKQNGTALGPTSGQFTNIAIVKSGRGRIVYFSGPLVEDTIVSTVVLNILQSCLTHLVKVIYQQSITLNANSRTTNSKNLTIPSIYLRNQFEAAAYVVQTDYLGTFASFSYALL